MYSNCLGIVLTGGKSSRMGKDKAQLMRIEQSMLDYSYTTLEKSGVEYTVISGQNHGVKDIVANAGPLGGIYSVIKKYQPKAIVALPVDLPFVSSEILRKLRTIGELTNKACYYHRNYLPLYLPVTAHVEQYFTANIKYNIENKVKQSNKNSRLSIRALLSETPNKVLPLDQEQVLFNANTSKEWELATKILEKNRINHGFIST